jgi:hypothetical protein
MNTLTSEKANQAPTERKDAWWLEPLLVALGFTAFIVYATWRAFENNFYEIGPYLSPFYSPHFAINWVVFGWKVSPAILILPIPAFFRATCYYYRKAYYRAYFQDPPACAVSHHGGKQYCGENSFPLVTQNLHRYFFYLATLVLAVLWYDALHAFFHDGGLHISSVGIIMLANVILLSGYTFGCHACRHLVGGRLDCFSSCSAAKTQFKLWNFVTKFNEHHMEWAWLSLFSVALTDLYIRQISCGQLSVLGLF